MMDRLTQHALNVFYAGSANNGVEIRVCGSETNQIVTAAHHENVLRVIQGGLSEQASHVVVPAGFGAIDMSSVNGTHSDNSPESSLHSSLVSPRMNDKPDRS